MRGLTRPGHVRLLHGYCPFCFKGCPGKSGSAWHPASDPRVDQEQASMPSGLPALDLTNAGDPCPHTQMCRMTCLVCGKSMADGDEPQFKSLAELLDELDSRMQEHREQVATMQGMQLLADTLLKDLTRRRTKALRKFGLAWIDRWEKPVHVACAKETPCQCVVPVFSDMCRMHKKRLPPMHTRRPPAPVTKRTMPAPPPSSKPPAPEILPLTNRSSLTLTKATWLQKPSEIASTSSTYKPAPSPASITAPFKKKKPAPPKPNLRLQAAAVTCQKMERFTSAGGSGTKGHTASEAAPGDSGEGDGEYDLAWHEANFDPWKHGDFWKGGRMWYRRPDGRVIPSFEGVRQFTPNGYFMSA